MGTALSIQPYEYQRVDTMNKPSYEHLFDMQITEIKTSKVKLYIVHVVESFRSFIHVFCRFWVYMTTYGSI